MLNVPMMASGALLEQAAIFAERRQAVLAGNIANISTPHYRARDLPVADFQAALKAAVKAGPAATTGTPNSTGTLPAGGELKLPDYLFEARERNPTVDTTYQDGAHRNIEQEVLELTKNSMLQRFATEMLNAQFGLLETVISERVA